MLQLLGQQPLRHFRPLMKALGEKIYVVYWSTVCRSHLCMTCDVPRVNQCAGLEGEVMGSRLDLERWMDGLAKGGELMTARRDLIAKCDAVFLTRDRAEWMHVFDEGGVWYEKVQTYKEVVKDPQAQRSASGSTTTKFLSLCA